MFPVLLQPRHQLVPLRSSSHLANAQVRRELSDAWVIVFVAGDRRPDCRMQIKQRFVRIGFEPNGEVTLAMAEGVERRQADLERRQIATLLADLLGHLGTISEGAERIHQRDVRHPAVDLAIMLVADVVDLLPA